MDAPRWHAALAFALTGEHRDDLAEPERPDVEAVISRLGVERLATIAAEREAAEQPWPWSVPADLMVGIGFGQWAAVLTAARLVVLAERTRAAGRVLRDRPLDADESRLTADRPPHWG